MNYPPRIVRDTVRRCMYFGHGEFITPRNWLDHNIDMLVTLIMEGYYQEPETLNRAMRTLANLKSQVGR